MFSGLSIHLDPPLRLRRLAARIHVGLRLFWHLHGKKKHLLLLWGIFQQLSFHPISAPYSSLSAAMVRFCVGFFTASTGLALAMVRPTPLSRSQGTERLTPPKPGCRQYFQLDTTSCARLYAVGVLVFALSLSALIGGLLGNAWNIPTSTYPSCTTLRGSFGWQAALPHCHAYQLVTLVEIRCDAGLSWRGTCLYFLPFRPRHLVCLQSGT